MLVLKVSSVGLESTARAWVRVSGSFGLRLAYAAWGHSDNWGHKTGSRCRKRERERERERKRKRETEREREREIYIYIYIHIDI